MTPLDEGLVDLHCHVLPSVDDGPPDTASAVELVLRLEELGFSKFHPTPHQRAGLWAPSTEQTARAAEELRAALAQTPSHAAIQPPAGENMWDELFLERSRLRPTDSFPTYVGGHAFLLEFPPGALPPAVKETLFQIHLAGRLPVLAHVERYPQTFKNLQRAEDLAQHAALLVNLSALGGTEGWAAKRLGRALVKAGLVHALSSDAHQTEDIPGIAAGLRWVRASQGEEALGRLLRAGPQRIIAGELPEW